MSGTTDSKIGPNKRNIIKPLKKNGLFLKDLPPIQGANPSSAGGPTQIIASQDGYLQHNENDLEVIADFEEELSRRGHYQLIFPLANNIDTYRPYLSC